MTDSLLVQAVVNTVLRHLEQREAKNDPKDYFVNT